MNVESQKRGSAPITSPTQSSSQPPPKELCSVVEEEQAVAVLDKLQRTATRRKGNLILSAWKETELLDALSRLYLWVHGFRDGRMSQSLLEATGIREVVRDLLSSVERACNKLDVSWGRLGKLLVVRWKTRSLFGICSSLLKRI
jgi:hypothetical protein